ncbi:MAG TPA: hypothetical protein VF221_08990 [Chloroflexota bacterium]
MDTKADVPFGIASLEPWTPVQTTSGGSLLLPILRWRETSLEVAAAEIGEHAWTAAWNEGRAMSLEQASAYALEESSADRPLR